MTRDELLAALTAERFNNRWWKTPEVEPEPDDPERCRWRRELAEREHDKYERKTRPRKAA
jgi:hypothetical protein